MIQAAQDGERLGPPPFREALEGLHAAVSSGGHVLICGEPGTGHERVARAIHVATDKAPAELVERLLCAEDPVLASEKPLIVVECSRNGDVEGRLLGADSAGPAPEGSPERVEIGTAFHQALHGTLILRQITELPRRIQARLVKILRDDEVEFVERGRRVSSAVGIRAIATVETDAPQDGLRLLQPELLKRLSATIIDLPPLRQRRHEIPALAATFLAQACARIGCQPKNLSGHASELLCALEWRGNIDELRGAVWALAHGVTASRIRMTDVLSRVRLEGRSALLFGGTLKEARARFEREYVAHVLEQHNNHMTDAARALGIQRTNLYRKVRQLSVERRKLSRERT